MGDPRAWVGVYPERQAVDVYVEGTAFETLGPWKMEVWSLGFTPDGMLFELRRANRGQRFITDTNPANRRATFSLDEVRNSPLLLSLWPHGARKIPLQDVQLDEGYLLGSQPRVVDRPIHRGRDGHDPDALIRVVKADHGRLCEKARVLRKRQNGDCYSAEDVHAFLRLLGVEVRS